MSTTQPSSALMSVYKSISMLPHDSTEKNSSSTFNGEKWFFNLQWRKIVLQPSMDKNSSVRRLGLLHSSLHPPGRLGGAHNNSISRCDSCRPFPPPVRTYVLCYLSRVLPQFANFPDVFLSCTVSSRFPRAGRKRIHTYIHTPMFL